MAHSSLHVRLRCFRLLRPFELFDHVQSMTRLDHGQPCVNVVADCRHQLRRCESSWQAVEGFIKYVAVLPETNQVKDMEGMLSRIQTFNKMRSGM